MQPRPSAGIYQQIKSPLEPGPESRQLNLFGKEQTMLGTILVVFLILALVGALPRWSHSRDWGYVPTGGLGLVLLVVVILALLGRI